jgi:hypothetical protein
MQGNRALALYVPNERDLQRNIRLNKQQKRLAFLEQTEKQEGICKSLAHHNGSHTLFKKGWRRAFGN